MLDIQRVLKQDRLLRAMTGLNRKAFEALLETFSRLYAEARQQQPRQRAVRGAGRRPIRAIWYHDELQRLLQQRFHWLIATGAEG
jgi:hypothetical protein